MYRNLWGCEIGREIVLLGEHAEGLETDSSAHFSVGWRGTANHKTLTFANQCFRLC
jgi:hypothetical protein